MPWVDIIAVILGLLGLVGCVLPVLPGPPMSWAGMLVLFMWGGGISSRTLIIWLVVAIVVTVLDYIVPSYFTRITGGSKSAVRGSLAGLLVGLIFFPPFGMIAGAFLGALLAEMLIDGKALKDSLKPAFGSFLGFLASTLMKLATSAVMMFYIIKAIC